MKIEICNFFTTINPHTVVKKLHPYPVLWGPHGPRGLFELNLDELYYCYCLDLFDYHINYTF